MSKPRILVTGGAGYIGSMLVPQLLEEGFEVTILDNFLYRQASLNQLCFHKNFKIVNGDVRIPETIKPLLSKADIIIPLAALVGAPACKRDPIAARTINHDAIELMLKNISKDQLVIMPTTNSAYGHGGENHECDETSPLNPISAYAVDKVEVEEKLMKHSNAISLRLATVFGMSPRMRIDLLVNDFTYRAVNDGFVVLFEGHFIRNYIHIKDIANAFSFAISNFSKMKGEIFNVGLSDTNISKLELCQRIQTFLPHFVYHEAPLTKDPDQRNYIVSNAKMESLGFKTSYSLNDGIAELIKGYTMLRNGRYGNI